MPTIPEVTNPWHHLKQLQGLMTVTQDQTCQVHDLQHQGFNNLFQDHLETHLDLQIQDTTQDPRTTHPVVRLMTNIKVLMLRIPTTVFPNMMIHIMGHLIIHHHILDHQQDHLMDHQMETIGHHMDTTQEAMEEAMEDPDTHSQKPILDQIPRRSSL